ncbi:MAG: LPS-assembly protein LptD [Treponema sp.]|nr:LPS-assembly protein LptD [Treponema sp.]
MSAQRQRTEMEIRTSTLSELAVWCRSLGLSESGTREELSKRLRDHFELPSPGQEEDRRRVITIESAQTSEYFTLDIIDEEYARLRGNVSLSLKDGETIHRIRANEVLFNRTRNVMTARGQVIYEKEDGDSLETFRGENITVNLDDWSSVFNDGSSTIESGGSAYHFSGSVITRTGEDVTILTDAEISNASNPEALWSISASRLWLLPGSDFAIFNAVLKVGEIPVLYIPFFYFPGDELVFHPVVGYRSREGAFVQTTTYILGQPRSDPDDVNSISRILGSSDETERELQGFFLRSTGRKRINQDEISLKALIDYYVNLGTYLGLELSVPKSGMFNQTNLSLGVGFTRTITQVGNGFTPYLPPDFDGSVEWNHSRLFSMDVPFRYRMRFNSSITGRYGSLSWDFPYYSDPYVDRDFIQNRAERMDFLNMMQQGIVTASDSLTQNILGSYQWQISGNLNPPVQNLSPFISRISITNISTSLVFKTLTDSSVPPNNPGHLFYAPDKYTIYSISGSISGTPFNTGRTQPQTRNNTSAREAEDPFSGIGVPISPWTEGAASERIVSDDILVPPVINQNFRLPGSGNTVFSIDYTISPTSTTELQFMSGYGRWKTNEDVDWNDVQSILTSVSANSTVNFRANHSAGLYNNTFSFFGSGTWRDYTFLNEDAEAYRTPQDPSGTKDPARVDTARRQQYSQTNYNTSFAYNGTLRPFIENQIFSQTNFQYDLRGTMVRSRRYNPNTVISGPELTPQWGTWAKETNDTAGLVNHLISANLEANLMNNVQNLSVRAALPPLDGLVTTNAIFRFWISETIISFRTEKPETSAEWILRPIHFTETLKFKDIGSLSYYMVINPQENNEVTTIRTSLSLWSFKAEFTATKVARSVFVPTDPLFPSGGGRWEQQGLPSLNPRELSFTYNHTFSNIEIVKDFFTLSFNINTSLNFDLQQHTSSSFNLSLGLQMNIAGFLELKLAAVSQNNVIWRYFKGVPGFDHLTFMYRDGPQNNLFIDLVDSFNFFDDSKRRRSGFKMHRFELTATHFLGDWVAELGINFYPHLSAMIPSVSQKYEITADVSFIVRWIPIPEIKSQVNYHGRHDRWEY